MDKKACTLFSLSKILGMTTLLLCSFVLLLIIIFKEGTFQEQQCFHSEKCSLSYLLRTLEHPHSDQVKLHTLHGFLNFQFLWFPLLYCLWQRHIVGEKDRSTTEKKPTFQCVSSVRSSVFYLHSILFKNYEIKYFHCYLKTSSLYLAPKLPVFNVGNWKNNYTHFLQMLSTQARNRVSLSAQSNQPT